MQSIWIEPILAVLFGYMLGSIPFGLLLTRFTGGGDLREVGSGNIGATNVLRTGNKAIAALTLLLDVGKGVVAVIVASTVDNGQNVLELGMLAGMGAFLGHLYPVWLKFTGGKGVATLLGIVAALALVPAIVFAVTWLAALAIFRYSSVAGMLASVSVPVTAVIVGNYPLTPMFICCALLVIWKHRANVARLMAGTEPKVGAS